MGSAWGSVGRWPSLTPRVGQNKMSFILTDTSDQTRYLQLNAWHWRTILMLLDVADALPKERIEVMGISGACPTLSGHEARSIASTLRSKVLSGLESDDRLLFDGTITKEPDDGIFFRDPKDQHRNYSTNAQVIGKLCDFCERCDGFTIH